MASNKRLRANTQEEEESDSNCQCWWNKKNSHKLLWIVLRSFLICNANLSFPIARCCGMRVVWGKKQCRSWWWNKKKTHKLLQIVLKTFLICNANGSVPIARCCSKRVARGKKECRSHKWRGEKGRGRGRRGMNAWINEWRKQRGWGEEEGRMGFRSHTRQHALLLGMQKVIAADANLPANPTPSARGFTRLAQINPTIFHKKIHRDRDTARERERAGGGGQSLPRYQGRKWVTPWLKKGERERKKLPLVWQTAVSSFAFWTRSSVTVCLTAVVAKI